MIEVEVAFARPDKQEIVTVSVEEGTSALDAVKQSGIVGIFPEIDPESSSVKEIGWRSTAR